MIIVFSGLDGCGKTTQAMMLKGLLEKQGGKCAYFHIVRSSLYHFILHSIVGRFSPKVKENAEAGLRGKGRNKKYFYAVVKKVFLFVELIRFNLIALFYKGSGKRHIICDRYFYDELVQALYLGIAGGFFAGIYSRLIPPPDVVFFLTGESGTFKDRKKEHDDGYYAEKSVIYEEFMKGVNVRRISSDRDVSLVHGEVAAMLNDIQKGI